ncbi:MogA/MoaB family molybdenum cofactor biosynthesis protein, partial [Clavibacter phaseoli]|uniref:MogA/MoaB family molybdenum cofactor biosynthesis protein n=1 Tax=Clavibacter phaseoli TaxID=1734031 RepID=UPI002174E957
RRQFVAGGTDEEVLLDYQRHQRRLIPRITPTDRTPEATAPLLDLEIPGIMEEARRTGVAHTPTAVLTRGHAGLAGGAFVMNLPGSPGGVRDGLGALDRILDHVLEQARGAVHPATDPAADTAVPGADDAAGATS